MSYKATDHFKARFNKRLGFQPTSEHLNYFSWLLENRKYKVNKKLQKSCYKGTLCEIRFKKKDVMLAVDRKQKILITIYIKGEH